MTVGGSLEITNCTNNFKKTFYFLMSLLTKKKQWYTNFLKKKRNYFWAAFYFTLSDFLYTPKAEEITQFLVLPNMVFGLAWCFKNINRRISLAFTPNSGYVPFSAKLQL